jgi:arylsulfatase A-like enzyme
MRRRGFAISLVLLAALCTGCTPSDASPLGDDGAPLAGQDCLLIVMDALHASHLGCYGAARDTSPTIDALAASGLRFENAHSNAAWTLPSTATLFTGLYQETHGLEFDKEVQPIRLDERADTLAELFQRAGYETIYAGQNPFAGDEWGLGQGFEHYEYYRLWTDDMIQDLEARLSVPGERPRFTYVHLRRPHTPYDPASEHRAAFVDAGYEGGVTGSDDDISRHNNGVARMDVADLQRHSDLYEGNIHQADAWLGRLLKTVDRDSTLIVFASDHGEAFGEHGTLGHNWHTWEEYLRIPLILAHPLLSSGQVVDAPVTTVDIMPTLVALFGLPAPGQPLQGRSFAEPLMGASDWPSGPVFASSRALNQRRELSVIEGRWKYTRVEPGGLERLYDLVADPSERDNLAARQPAVTARLRQTLLDWRAPQRRGYTSPSPGLSEEALEQLRELGYLR